jgi:predicted amidohydrolase
MNVTVVQSKVSEGIENNVKHMTSLLQEPLSTDLIVLPEMWTSPYQNDAFLDHAVEVGDNTYKAMQQIAMKQTAYLIAGSVPERDGSSLFNTAFVFDPRGELIAKYRKIHLFEITYPDGRTYREKDIIHPGNKIITFDTPYGRIGLQICFDIRFPILSKKLQEQGAELIVVPAAFNQYTGPKHWELAFRSRAVDNQLFTIGVSPSVNSAGEYKYYGHSIIVNPLGDVLYQMDESEEVATIEINLNEVKQIRKAFPILLNEIVL